MLIIIAKETKIISFPLQLQSHIRFYRFAKIVLTFLTSTYAFTYCTFSNFALFAKPNFFTISLTTCAIHHIFSEFFLKNSCPLFCFTLSQNIIIIKSCNICFALFTIKSAVAHFDFHPPVSCFRNCHPPIYD